jgi:D-alanyl-D-alanine carboxypeptidase/D-alanyl-D-alanine-endopeptidase (penicillin-binding protein 4)
MYRFIPLTSISIRVTQVKWFAVVLVAWAATGGASPAANYQGPDPNGTFARIFEPSDNWCVAIAEAESGRILYEHRADEPCLPASNMKVYVTTTAFEVLGTRYRYRTPLMGKGVLDHQGIWHGDLMVRGSGDPAFSGRFEDDKTDVTGRLERWAQLLAGKGVHRVAGNVYGLDDLYDKKYWAPGWPDKAYCDWYTAPSGALILNDSCIDVAVYPTKPGQPPAIRKFPDTSFIQITNAAVTTNGSGRTTLSLIRPFDSNDFKLSGKIFLGSGPTQITATITDPTAFFIHTFKEVLEARGIEVDGEALDADQIPSLPRRGWEVLAWNESPTLTELAKVIDTKSQNLFADSLLKTLGYRKSGIGSWSGGEQVVREFVQSLGIPAEHLHMEDGSGLSRLDRVTARDTLQLLLRVQTKGWFPDWKGTLAVSGGSEGSLRKRLKTPLLEGKVFAKTGFIDDVYCLSGYVHSKNNHIYAFSMLFNGKNQSGKHPHERMEEALTILAREER